MRPKLVLGVSFLAALVGAGSCIGIVLALTATISVPAKPGLLVSASLLLPIATIIFAAVFVYRHTARRRKLQAFVTAVLATFLTLGFFVLTTILSARRGISDPPAVTQPHTAT
jgi:purine-cytosine permease-like protein